MHRTETIGDATLYLGDCRDVLPTLERFDAIVTDPPYGIAHVKGAGGHGKHNRRNIAPIHGDDAPFNPTAFLDYPEVIMWGADHYAYSLPRGRWLVWDKLAGMESYDSFSDVEVAWFNKPGAARIKRHMWKGICQASEKDATREHPTQKPIVIMEWCLSHLSQDARTICDPFMGSGTTGVACIRAGLKFTGIEVNENYFDIARRRIEEAWKQPRLFEGPKPKPLTVGDLFSLPSDVYNVPMTKAKSE